MILRKKTAWIILLSLFTFDNFFSYYAITKLSGREANLAIAAIVESYPMLYFVCIPLSVIIMHVLELIFRNFFSRAFIKYEMSDLSIQSRLISTAFAIYWAIGNSLMNLAFLLKKSLFSYMSLPNFSWGLSTVSGIFIASLYSIIILRNYQKSKKTF